MNELTKIGGVLAMDSREIAKLLGARHSDVFESIATQLPKAGYTAIPYTYDHPQNGQKYQYFMLPYRETMILVSGYSIELRARIVDRWIELEKASAPAIPKTYAEALQLAADQAKEIEQKTQALALAAPKIEAHDALMRSDRTMSITDCAKHFKLHPKLDVFPYLRFRGYLTIAGLPSQSAIDAGYLSLREVKAQGGKVYPQTVVEAGQLDTWRTRVVPQIEAWIRIGRR